MACIFLSRHGSLDFLSGLVKTVFLEPPTAYLSIGVIIQGKKPLIISSGFVSKMFKIQEKTTRGANIDIDDHGLC